MPSGNNFFPLTDRDFCQMWCSLYSEGMDTENNNYIY